MARKMKEYWLWGKPGAKSTLELNAGAQGGKRLISWGYGPENHLASLTSEKRHMKKPPQQTGDLEGKVYYRHRPLLS